MRIPIYGMTFQICLIFGATYFMASCVTAEKTKPFQLDKSKIQYKFPNVLDTQPKLCQYPLYEN